MYRIQCEGRRRLEVSQRPDGGMQIKIVLGGGQNKTLATLQVSPSEAAKMQARMVKQAQTK